MHRYSWYVHLILWITRLLHSPHSPHSSGGERHRAGFPRQIGISAIRGGADSVLNVLSYPYRVWAVQRPAEPGWCRRLLADGPFSGNQHVGTCDRAAYCWTEFCTYGLTGPVLDGRSWTVDLELNTRILSIW